MSAPPSALRPEHRLTTRLLRAANVLFSRIYHQVDVLTPQRLPRTGAGILVCNHISGLDPLLIQSVCSRMVIWMMAKEYYELRPMNSVFRAIDVIPVDRNGRDTTATRAALRALHGGRILGIFPEGQIATTRELLPFQTGAALMAARAGVPVYPAYLDGTQRGQEILLAVARPNHATLSFGPPLHFSREEGERDALNASAEKIRRAVYALSRNA